MRCADSNANRGGMALGKTRPSKTKLPEHIAGAIHQAWPDGIIEMPNLAGDSPFWDNCQELKRRLAQISGSKLVYEREPRGGPRWNETTDPEGGPPDWSEESRSYALFFLSPLDDRFSFETETLEPDEEGVERRFRGMGWAGCAVAVSMVAPFAILGLEEFETFENGSRSEPDVEPRMFNLDGQPLDLEQHYRELFDDVGLAALRKLRASIESVLRDVQIAVIPGEDSGKPVPWLKAGDEVFLGHSGEPITVRQAFFFRGL
jgi:hypothetical protein